MSHPQTHKRHHPSPALAGDHATRRLRVMPQPNHPAEPSEARHALELRYDRLPPAERHGIAAPDPAARKLQRLEGILDVCRSELQLIRAQRTAALRSGDSDRCRFLHLDREYQVKRCREARRQLQSIRLVMALRDTITAIAPE